MKITRQTFTLAAATAVVAFGALAALPASARPLVSHAPIIQYHHHRHHHHHHSMHKH